MKKRHDCIPMVFHVNADQIREVISEVVATLYSTTMTEFHKPNCLEVVHGVALLTDEDIEFYAESYMDELLEEVKRK